MKYLNHVLIFAIAFIVSCTNSREKSESFSKKYGDALVCDNPRYNIGEVSKSKQDNAKFIFKITNNSNKTINISDVDVTCGCIYVAEYKNVITPQNSFVLKGFIDLRKQYGHISKPIFVKYNNDNVLLIRVVGDITN